MASPAFLRLVKRLRKLREARKLTQEGFAEAAGISYKYYQAMESGRKNNPRLSTLEVLARAHGIAVHELLSPDSANSAPRKRRPRR